VYGVSGVWVADASVLPTSSGVNPMVTSMAVAHKVARGVVEGWKAGAVGGASAAAKL
jgi:choline dehydrogenase-like flavoprotein